MSFDTKKVGVLSRRVFILSTLKILAFCIIFGRLFNLQVLAYRKYLDKSNNNHTKSFVIPPERGLILDANGEKIAYNAKYWRVIIKSRKKDFENLYKTLDILEVPKSSQEYFVNLYKKNPFEDFIVYEYLTPRQLINIEVNLPYLRDVYAVEGIARYYRHSRAYSNILGYVKSPTVDDIRSGRSKHPDIKIGANGIERIYNDSLSGVHGYNVIETDAFGYKVRDLSIKPSISGEDISLTLNVKVQEFMSELAGTNVVSSSVVNIQTGNIIGIVSSPNFNSERLSHKITQMEWRGIVEGNDNPMLNRAYQATYAPGSLFKVVVALTALLKGINPKKTFHCNGKHKVGRRTFHCWKRQGHGKMDLHNAIKHSCNVYFYNLADYINEDDIYDVAVNVLGFSDVFDTVPFIGQKSGLIPNSKWARESNKSFYRGDLINMVIGQGNVLCTVLQLSIMMARIASGKKVMPFIENNNKSFPSLDISEENLAILRAALYDGANTVGGTSYRSRIYEKQYKFAGKTGTAQVVSKFVSDREYKIANEKPHGLFGGFAPFDNPKFAISTVYEKGGYGARTALPFSSNVLYYVQKLYDGRIAEAESFRRQIIAQVK
ncbi:MAG: penicillin-binding protein 2 [Candidatus Deianiraeaceae bacterium]|jgi:penicillin-binding protein 2